MSKMGMVGALKTAAAALGSVGAGVMEIATPAKGNHHKGRTRYDPGHRPRNSWYIPHQGPREVARRLRQAERNEQRQRERAAALPHIEAYRVSRRGLAIETSQQAVERGA